MPFLELKQSLAELIVTTLAHVEVTQDAILSELTAPPTAAMGHLALPCFRLSKWLKKPPDKIGQDLVRGITGRFSGTAVQAGPYVNFRWDARFLYERTVSQIFREADRYGTDRSGQGRCIVLEYCSPNIAKKLAFQHIRSTLIGNALANVYERLGYKTERINFVGDWGSQFARLLAAVELWGDSALITSSDRGQAMAHLLELYVRFHREVENDASLLQKASDCLRRLEAHDPRSTKLWQAIRDVSLATAQSTLARMNVRFQHVEGESHYIPAIAGVLEEVKKKAGARPSEGAWIVEVPGLSTPALVQKKDGTTLYLTRDIAAALDRYQRFTFERMLYVVSEQQKLHFQLLFGVLKLMGMEWASCCEHVSFGTVLFGSEKMSTREGRVIFLDDILDEAKRLALAECAQKNPSLTDKEAVAEAVGIGAVIFGELSSYRSRDIQFDWKQILSFDGETGPYVQYAAVRCQSLLEKAAEKGAKTGAVADLEGYEFSAEEEQLILALSKQRSAYHAVVKDNEPCHLTAFLIEVAKAFNRFYYRFPVLQATDERQRDLRLSLVGATRQVLQNGLHCLGIVCPQEM